MKFFKSRKAKLKERLEYLLEQKTIDITSILACVDAYETDNLDTIEVLRRKKKITLKKINGALRNTINVHGPITKFLISSASKRILGTLLENENKTLITRIKQFFKWKK